MAATDLLGIGGVAAGGTLAVLYATSLADHGVEDQAATYLAPLLCLGLAYAGFRFFYRGWCRRASARFRFLAPLLDDDEVTDLAMLLLAVNAAISISSILLITVPVLVLIGATVTALELSPWFTIGSLLLLVLLSWPGIFSTAMQSDLMNATALHLTARRKRVADSRLPGTPEGDLPPA